MVLGSALILLLLAPLVLATGHFSVRIRLSSLSPVPVRTTLSIYGVEREVTVSGTAYVTMDYTLEREHLVRDKPHLLSITTSSTDGVITEDMELRRFARSAHTVKGRLRIVGESVECKKNFYGPFCWVQCVTSPGDGLVCDSEGVPSYRRPSCTEPNQKKTNVPFQNGQLASESLKSSHQREQFTEKQGPVYSVTFENPVSTNLLLVLNAFLCQIVLVAGLVLICIALRLRSIKTEVSSQSNAQTQEQFHNNDSISSAEQDDLIRFSPTRSDDLFNAAKENYINNKIEDCCSEYSTETENIYEIV